MKLLEDRKSEILDDLGYGNGFLGNPKNKQMGKQWKQWLTLFFWAPKSLQMMIAAMKLKDACSLEGKL